MKSFPDVCYLMNQIVILKQPVFECIQIIVGVFHLSRISPGNFFHVFHGECFSIFQPTYNQEFLYPANGKQCHFHFGTDHIVIDCSTEISIDKEHHKLLTYVLPFFFVVTQCSIHLMKFFANIFISFFVLLIEPLFGSIEYLIPLWPKTF